MAENRWKLLRIVDANLNRAGEAARIVEECARFVLDHAGLAALAKGLRHRLAAASLQVGVKSLLTSRDTAGDVGTQMTGQLESIRTGLDGLLRANFQRLEQALRVLEEYSKLLGGDASSFEAMRYDVYTLEKQFADPPEKPAALADENLMVLVGTSLTVGGTAEEVLDLTSRVLEGGCRLIQLREKEMPDGDCLALAGSVVSLAHQVAATVIIDDRASLVAASGADGVHLGINDLPIEDARRILGPSKLVGMTAHSEAELRDAESRGADYIGVGTMFASPTKPDLAVKGPAELIPAAAACSVPCYAIGGITRENVGELLQAGATRIAIASSVTSADDVAEATAWFVDRLASTETKPSERP